MEAVDQAIADCYARFDAALARMHKTNCTLGEATAYVGVRSAEDTLHAARGRFADAARHVVHEGRSLPPQLFPGDQP